MHLDARVAALEDYVRTHRQNLHQIPELGLCEFKTQAYLLEALSGLGADVVEVMADTGIRVVFHGTSRVVALRADMDALEVKEPDKPYASQHEGRMHACGHDGHMAMLLGAAKLLGQTPPSVRPTTVLLFQPAEETVGGAKRMIEAGALDEPKVEEVYGMHVMPDVAAGKVAVRAGAMMAQVSEFEYRLEGQSVHGATPHLGTDPIAAAAHLYTLMQSTLARRINPKEPAVLTVGHISGGTAPNILAPSVLMQGTFRSYSKQVYQTVASLMLENLRAVEAAFGVRGTYEETTYYPAVINDERLTAYVQTLIEEDFVPTEARTVGEDFSFYQEKVPGVFVFLGVGTDEQSAPLHSPEFDFEETALLGGVELYRRILVI